MLYYAEFQTPQIQHIVARNKCKTALHQVAPAPYRWHKAAFDGAKQVAKLQAEAKAATAQSDTATAAAMEAKGLAKRLEALAIQKQQHTAVHVAPGQQVQIQSPEAKHAQQAQRAAPAATHGPAKASVLLKPPLLVHSPSRLSRMTPRASLQDDHSPEESGQGVASTLKSLESFQDRVSGRSSISRTITPQDSAISDSHTARQSHDRHQAMQQSDFDNPPHTRAFQASLKQSLPDSKQTGSLHAQPQLPQQSGDMKNQMQDRLQSQTSISVEHGPGSASARRSTLQHEVPTASDVSPTEDARQQQTSSRRPTLQSLQHDLSGQASSLSAAVHAVDQAFEQETDRQEWEQTDGDDIAAAVAQYTGSKQRDLPAQEADQQVPNAQQAQHDNKPRLAVQHGDNFKKSDSFHHREQAGSDRHPPELSYAEQQARMDAEFEAAMAADQDMSNADLQANGSTVQHYASPQEQMEAELEAAMAADAAGQAEETSADVANGDMALLEDEWQDGNATAGRACEAVTWCMHPA